MTTVGRGSLKIALASIRATKWRSLLTMLGVIIGIVSVVTIVGIGEGVKQQVASQVNRYGEDLVTIRPGKVHAPDSKEFIMDNDVLFGRASLSGLTTGDVDAVRAAEHVGKVAPLGTVSGAVTYNKSQRSDMLVLATSPDLPVILDQEIKYGSFFSDDSPQSSAVIGHDVAEELFGDMVPLGQSFVFRGQTFIVRGMFAEFNASPLSPTSNFDKAIFIPYQAASQITNGSAQFYGILAKPDNPENLKPALASIKSQMSKSHGGANDFTVLDQTANLNMSRSSVDLLSGFIVVVAGIALLVGGVGIMNIMLVSVTERMHEIGVRKAIGATNGQILSQFVLEAVVLSGAGGIVGVITSIVAAWLLRTYTDYNPVITLPPILIATSISIVIGVIFGLLPAIKAASKDPIAALRHE